MDDVFTFTYLAVTPGFSTPAEYNDFRNSLFVFMLLLFFIRIITLLMLIKNGQKCMNMEVNGEDPSNYSHGVRIINRRGIKLKNTNSSYFKAGKEA